MVVPARQRWIAYLVVLALTPLAIRFAVGQDPAPPNAVGNATGRVTRPLPAAAPATVTAPTLQLDRLASRTARGPAGDPFGPRSWEQIAAEETQRNVPPPPPPRPQAPPLPFAFMGRLIDGGTVTVFLTRDDRNYVVRAGDVLDDAYAVEAIEPDRLVVTYLPLRTRQTLALPATGAADAPRAAGTAKRQARDDEDDD